MTNSSGLHNLGDVLRLPLHGESTALIDLREEAAARQLSEFIAAYFGIMRMGAVAVPVNHKLPRDTIAHIFRDSAIELTFADAARRPLVPQSVPVIDLDGDHAAGFGAFLDPGLLDTFLPEERDLAEILYTSGSTGLPKGVPLNHHGQLWAIDHYLEPLPAAAPPDTTIVVAPLYHMNGLFNITVALAKRFRVISLPRFDARRFLDAAAQYRCTVLSGIPTMFALMVRERDLIDRLDLSAVSDVTIGSAPLTDALLAQVQKLFPNAEIRNGFGTTEAGPAVFGGDGEQVLTISARTGIPVSSVVTGRGMRTSVETFQISRVTLRSFDPALSSVAPCRKPRIS